MTTEAQETFTERATALGAHVIGTDSTGLLPALTELCAGPGGVGVSTDLVDALPGLAVLRTPVEGWPETAVSRALLGIASLGSIVLADPDRSDRLLHLLAARHIAVLPTDALVLSSEVAAPAIDAWLAGGPGYVTLVAGPSRTSDIEKILTIGVHGPGELVIVLVEDWDVHAD